MKNVTNKFKRLFNCCRNKMMKIRRLMRINSNNSSKTKSKHKNSNNKIKNK